MIQRKVGKRRGKELLSLLCVLAMLSTFTGCGDSGREADASDVKVEASGESLEATDVSSEVSDVKAEDIEDAVTEVSGVKSEDIVILYTNDVHCGIEDYIGYAGLADYKKAMESVYSYVSLVDCGDAVQGDFIGTVSEGGYIVDIMNHVGYDFAIMGNHEFDYGMEQLSALINKADAHYLGCNITYSGSGENLLSNIEPYEIVEYGEVKVAYIGVTTPESLTKSTPVYFMEDGEYVYGFSQGNEGQTLYDCVQGCVDECKEQGADYVVVLTHLGDAEESTPYTSIELIQATDGIDAVLDAHAHHVIPGQRVENSSGEEVLLSSTGTKLANIGKLVIRGDGTITTELVNGYSGTDAECETFIDNIQAQYETEMTKVVASSDIELSCTDENGARLVRNRETTIGNLCADAFRVVGEANIGMINGGGIRANLPEGDITYADMLAVQPFGNTLCVAEATGQEIADALEVAYRFTQSEASADGVAVGESGSFLQLSGLKCVIDTSIESTVELDEQEMFVAVNGERRVKDIQVLNESGEYEALDLEKTYTVASYDYILKEGGNSYQGFMDNTYLIDGGISDYQVLAQYITENLNGELGNSYAQLQDRIVVREAE